MTHAIRFHKTGGPEVLVWEEVELGKPGPGEARIRHTAVGLNFVDIDPESGQLPTPACPRTYKEVFIVGTEPTKECELHRQ